VKSEKVIIRIRGKIRNLRL